MLHSERSFIWCWNLDASGTRSETSGKFWNVVLEKDGEDQLDRSSGKWGSIIRVEEQRNILHEICKRKTNWIGHVSYRSCLLQRVIEGMIKGVIEVTGRRGRRRRKLLDDLKERRGYSHLKEEALDRAMWRARFGRGFGPVVRQNNKWYYWPEDDHIGSEHAAVIKCSIEYTVAENFLYICLLGLLVSVTDRP